MKLLTINQLAERWQVTPRTIQNYINSGKLTKVESLDVIRFNLDYIESLESYTGEPKSYKEIKLEKENKSLKMQLDKLKGDLGAITSLSTKWLRED